jgi:hypothetical protein
MLAAFAALEARVNAAVITYLSNRIVTVAPSAIPSFEGMFEDVGAAELEGLVQAAQPRLTASLADWPELPRGTQISLLNPATLAVDAFEVAGSDKDGAGFIVYALRTP